MMKKFSNIYGHLVVILLMGFSIPSFGQSWNAFSNPVDAPVYGLCTNSTMDTLFMGGGFIHSGTQTLNYVGAVANGTCVQMGMMMGPDNSMLGTNGQVDCITSFNHKMYIGGMFTTAESFTATHVAVWSQGSFAPVGKGFDDVVRCLAVYNNQLYAGGEFTFSGTTAVKHIAVWNDTSWVSVGEGMNDDVEAMIVYKGKLVVSGDFDSSGTTPMNHVAIWDGNKWASLGGGMTTSSAMNTMGMPAMVHSLCEYKGHLYAGGMFMYADGNAATNMAVWNDTSWANTGNIGTRMTDIVQCLNVYNGRLIAGGLFDMAGSLSVNNIAAWDGSAWNALGQGVDSNVEAMTVYKNHLIVGGNFNKAGGNNEAFLAQWQEATGIAGEDHSSISISAYPNPSNGKIILKGLNGPSAYNVTVTNSLGMKIFGSTIKNAGGTYSLDLSSFPHGIYFIAVNDGKGISSIRVVTNKD